ncbi:MAG TPA: hypothetical protein VNT60_02080 [Deinococcales bacterium]|nr:hypothetical protein [Deinococcales bacterium]
MPRTGRPRRTSLIAVRLALLLERLSRRLGSLPLPVRPVTPRVQEWRERRHRLDASRGVHAARRQREGIEFIPRDQYFRDVEQLLEGTTRGG